MNMKLSGGMMVFLGAVFWSLNAPIVKFLEVDAILLCGLRALIAGLSLCGFIRPKQLRWNGWMLLYLCCYCCLGLSVIFSLTMTSSAVAIGMQYTAIIWLFIINCIKSKSFDMRSFIPVCVVFAGVLFFMASGSGETSVMGQLLTLSEGIFFAGLTISSKKAAGTNPLGLTAVGNLVTGVVLLTAFPNAGASIAALSGLDWALMIILGVVQIGCGYAFYNLGVQKISAQKASLLSLWEMLLGPLWVALFLGEYPSTPVLIGFVIIIIGILLDVKLSQKAPEKSEAEVSAHHEASVSTVSC